MTDATECNADEIEEIPAATDATKPGQQLKALRKKHNHTIDYVASKLHLRVSVIEALEADAYDELPEKVFIKGYIRAYANLLGINPDPLLDLFNATASHKEPADRTLWQSQKARTHAHPGLRWGTAMFGLVVLASIFMWWNKSKETESYFSKQMQSAKAEEDVRVTDLSNMRSLLSSNQKTLSPLELKDE